MATQTWQDSTGGKHPLQITGAISKRLLKDCDLNLFKCLVDAKHIEVILAQLADSPEVLMAACACIEDIEQDELESYYSLWDGDAFESASIALLEAIADFFPKRPRAILTALIKKMQTASMLLADKAERIAMDQINKMDWSLAITESVTRGSGGAGSVESLATAANT